MPEIQVLDPASGGRMMYFDKAEQRVLFGDYRREDFELCDGREFHIHPGLQMDFREMPFQNDSFSLVVFDPPHLVNAGPNSWLAKKYGVLDKNQWREDLRRGFAECFRVLKSTGILIFKWNETQIKLSEILALTPNKPLFGNRQPRQSGTHWIVWTKEETE